MIFFTKNIHNIIFIGQSTVINHIKQINLVNVHFKNKLRFEIEKIDNSKFNTITSAKKYYHKLFGIFSFSKILYF